MSRSVSKHLGGLLLLMTGVVSSLSEGREKISDAVIDGRALSKFEAMMVAQGVSKETARSLCSAHTDYYSILRKAKHQLELKVPADGVILDLDGLIVAQVLHRLGAGRSKAGDPINHSVGAELLVSPGQSVKKGDSWLRLHYENPVPDQEALLQKALSVGKDNKPAEEESGLVAELLLPQ